MAKMSLAEAASFLEKFVTERTPLSGFLLTKSGVRVRVNGFLDSATVAVGLVISTSAGGDALAFLNVPLAGRTCGCEYGEVREFPAELRARIPKDAEESVLVFTFPDNGDMVALFFTV